MIDKEKIAELKWRIVRHLNLEPESGGKYTFVELFEIARRRGGAEYFTAHFTDEILRVLDLEVNDA